jgi:hypothetical protein
MEDVRWFEIYSARHYRFRPATEEETMAFVAGDDAMRASLTFYTVVNREGLSATFGSSVPIDWQHVNTSDELVAAMVAESDISLLDAVAVPERD